MNTIPSSLSKEEILHNNLVKYFKDHPDVVSTPSFEKFMDSHFVKSDAPWVLKAMEEYAKQLQPPGTSDAVEFAKWLLENFRANWINEIRETGWMDILPPFIEYSTEEAYYLFLQTKQST